MKKVRYHFSLLCIRCFQFMRGVKYAFISTGNVSGKIIKRQPVLFTGYGKVVSEGTMEIGVITSPFFLSTYAYIEARKPHSVIQFGDGVILNNNAVIISDGAGIFVGKDTIAGTSLEIYDSDFHAIEPSERKKLVYPTKPVYIGDNVFLGSNVKILKGVSIGDNSVIANGSIVTKDIPANTIAGGNPAIVIRRL